MPYATNDGVRISYEREGTGPPILLGRPGFSMALDDWRDFGFVDALRDDYELILMDPRGHGMSDKPHDPAAFTADQRVADVVAVLDDAGIERAVYWGYSAGGVVGFAAVRYAPERFRAFVIGGAAPDAGNPEAQRRQAAALRTEGATDLVAFWERRGWAVLPPMPGRTRTNDVDALAAQAIAVGDKPDFSSALAQLRVPMPVYAGEADTPRHDTARRAVAGNPQVRFVSLPGLDHFTALSAATAILPHVRVFLASAPVAQGAAHAGKR
jgi:pimeloyl-ACP methyl ester carboxylesterase